METTNKAPGVYVWEIDKPGPIAGVSTSVAAFVGPALGLDRVNTPRRITNWTQFVKFFGESDNVYRKTDPRFYAPFAVRGFFDNGGSICYFTRVGYGEKAALSLQDRVGKPILKIVAKQEELAGTGIKVLVASTNQVSGREITISADDRKQIELNDLTSLEVGSYVQLKQGEAPSEYHVVEYVNQGTKTITLDTTLANDFTPTVLDTLEFKLTIKGTSSTEEFPNLSVDSRHSRFFAKVIQSSQLVEVSLVEPASPSKPPNNLPDSFTEEKPLIWPSVEQYKAGIDALKRVDEVSILCVPDTTSQEVQKHMIEHCVGMQDRFAILDPVPSETGIEDQRQQLGSDKGYAALYYPRILVADPLGKDNILVPPSGHIAGLYARVDNERGVHKAPANETLRGVLGVQTILTDDEQGPLNGNGINALRLFPGRGVVVWGARTLAPSDNTAWRFINVRRLLLYIEESIQEGTRFAVFEPNNQALWQSVKRRVSDFLTRVWRAGALYGDTADEAFRVRVDEELNPADVRALGQLVIEVIVYPVTPAEYVEFRVIQEAGGPSVKE